MSLNRYKIVYYVMRSNNLMKWKERSSMKYNRMGVSENGCCSPRALNIPAFVCYPSKYSYRVLQPSKMPYYSLKLQSEYSYKSQDT